MTRVQRHLTFLTLWLDYFEVFSLFLQTITKKLNHFYHIILLICLEWFHELSFCLLRHFNYYYFFYSSLGCLLNSPSHIWENNMYLILYLWYLSIFWPALTLPSLIDEKVVSSPYGRKPRIFLNIATLTKSNVVEGCCSIVSIILHSWWYSFWHHSKIHRESCPMTIQGRGPILGIGQLFSLVKSF